MTGFGKAHTPMTHIPHAESRDPTMRQARHPAASPSPALGDEVLHDSGLGRADFHRLHRSGMPVERREDLQGGGTQGWCNPELMEEGGRGSLLRQLGPPVTCTPTVPSTSPTILLSRLMVDDQDIHTRCRGTEVCALGAPRQTPILFMHHLGAPVTS